MKSGTAFTKTADERLLAGVLMGFLAVGHSGLSTRRVTLKAAMDMTACSLFIWFRIGSGKVARMRTVE
jgi:hypothetical protein